MPRTEFYDQRTHSVVVDDLPLRDFGEGEDAIAFEIDGELVSVTRGLDRNAISRGSERPMTLVVRLKPTSPDLTRLQELADARTGFRLVDATVTTGVEDTVNLTNCGVEDRDFGTGGPTMQDRTFAIVASNYALSET